MVSDYSYDLESSNHADCPIILPSKDGGVKVGAEHDPTQVVVCSQAMSEDIAESVYGDLKPCLVHPANHEGSGLQVLLCESQPADSCLAPSPDSSQSLWVG